MRVRFVTFESKRTRNPTVSPTCSPNVDAIRAAAARAASRRGSRTRIFLPLAHGSSSRTSGTRVVLPAPGGATSTAALLPASAAARSGSASSMGRDVSKVRICRRRHPAPACVKTGSSGWSSKSEVSILLQSAFTGCPASAGHDDIDEFDETSCPRPPDAFINKAVTNDFLRPINIAQVDQHRLHHDCL